MNWLDIVIIVLGLWFVFSGFTSGLIREVIGLAGLVVGLVVAARYHPLLAMLLPFGSLENNVLAFAIIFFAILVLAQVLSSFLHQVVDLLLLGWLDQVGGAAFGLVKGALLLQVLVFVATAFPLFGLRDAVDGSLLAPILLAAMQPLLGLLAADFDPQPWMRWRSL